MVGRVALGVSSLMVVGWAAWASMWGLARTDAIQQALVRNMVQDRHAEWFEDGQLHVFTLGTGSPQLGGVRMPVANAVIAGDEFLLIDAGEGASRTMGRLQLPLHRITGVFITHWHSDHFAGLGQILNQSWNADRSHDVAIYGPEGVDRVMDGLARMYADDIHYRSAGEVEHNDPRYALGTPHTVRIPTGEPGTVVFDRNGVVVRAFHVDHGHVTPAYGYRVEYRGKSVVFSGDTIASPRVAAAAKGCDLLVHEAVNVQLMTNAAAALRELGHEANAARAEGVIGYHADTLGVARVAADAGVGTLVLSHIIPDADNPLHAGLFMAGMDEWFAGPIILADDGQHFAL